MGFFAVLKNSADNFNVKECHINLWALKGVLGRRKFLWDIGLRIEPGQTPLSRFQIALPSEIPPDGMTDLYDKLLIDSVGQLIFGRPVNVVNGNTIDYGEGPLRLSRVPPSQASIDNTRSNSGFTLWNVQVATPLAAGTQTYLRVRFKATGAGRVWAWKRFLFARYAALVDVRFLDIREAWNVKDGTSLQDLIVPIEKLFFFVIAPSSFHVVATSPPIHYIRILEGRAWEAYLGRKVSWLRKEKLAIYQWRNDDKKALSTKWPMRVYLDLEKQLGVLSVPNVFAFLLTLGLLCVLAVIISPDVPGSLRIAKSAVFGFAKRHLLGLTLTGSLIIAVKLLSKWGLFQKMLRSTKNLLGLFEDWVFSIG
jgi:hypothetical protein